MDGMSTDARTARVALACLVEPGSVELDRLIAGYGPEEALDAVVKGKVAEPVAESVRARLAGTDPRRIAETALARTARIGARVAIPEDEEWPVQVADLCRIRRPGGTRVDRDTAPPLCLWVRGEAPLAPVLDRSVAVVGARAATSYGTHVAQELSFGLANRGWTVVSGGAYGIDAAAHRGALAAGGTTVAVLACGVDRAYPAENASLFERIVEDSARSGARQTLGRAALLGRAVMAVPGPVTSAMSVGCHHLLRYGGARPVMSYAEVLEEVGRIGDDLAPIPRGPEQPLDRLGPELSRVLDGVPLRGGADAGQIAAAAGVSLRDALRALPLLESAGHVIVRDGGYVAARRRAPVAPSSGPGGPVP